MDNQDSKLILSLVKYRLGKIGNTNVLPEEVFKFAKIIQDEILLETKCKQIDFSLDLTSGKTGYLLDQPLHQIFSIIPSWSKSESDVPKYVNPSEWNDYKEVTGDRPLYFTMFSNKVWLASSNCESGDKITFWGYQTYTTSEMDSEHGPEVPREAFAALAAGICYLFNPEFLADYERLKLLLMKTDSSVNMAMGIQANSRSLF
ncbi:MAG: hypothetical protein ACP5N7_05630 [Candidatus Pacearchaeota archaeon]